MPTELKFKETLKTETEKKFRIEDPSQHYAPLHKLGEGG